LGAVVAFDLQFKYFAGIALLGLDGIAYVDVSIVVTMSSFFILWDNFF